MGDNWKFGQAPMISIFIVIKFFFLEVLKNIYNFFIYLFSFIGSLEKRLCLEQKFELAWVATSIPKYLPKIYYCFFMVE
jgi:hypothetical protein